jgi:phosphotransferase system enzyme I (PtsI)
MTIKAGKKLGKKVSVCGEMAGDTKLTRLLLGFGLRQFSMHPSHILMVKRQVLQSDIAKLSAASRKILGCQDSEKIEPLIQKMNLQ